MMIEWGWFWLMIQPPTRFPPFTSLPLLTYFRFGCVFPYLSWKARVALDPARGRSFVELKLHREAKLCFLVATIRFYSILLIRRLTYEIFVCIDIYIYNSTFCRWLYAYVCNLWTSHSLNELIQHPGASHIAGLCQIKRLVGGFHQWGIYQRPTVDGSEIREKNTWDVWNPEN